MTRMPSKISKLIIPIGAVALAAALVMLAARSAGLGWRADPEPVRVISAVDMPTFESVGDLFAEAEAVVMGTVSEVAGEAVDYGIDDSLKDPDGDEDEWRGIPVIFYEVDVEETLKGSVGSEIMVAKEKESFFGSDQSSDLRVNETVVLFLEETTASSSSSLRMPRADEFDNRFYVTVSLDNGVFDAAGAAAAVTDDTAFTPRMEHLFTQSSFTLGQMKQSAGVSDGSGQTGGQTGPGDGGGTRATN